ncbi:hypothetical protein VN97_g8747 [Penicillium thymicola]|uniref:Uncharacterized protein n=1 Tax=Penicillium thymicola TaxID=293382 RepID=A0AAI9TCQ3_PENTH|nr:hypothetical protein VN97_g8747 [Penicillium thymicola]
MPEKQDGSLYPRITTDTAQQQIQLLEQVLGAWVPEAPGPIWDRSTSVVDSFSLSLLLSSLSPSTSYISNLPAWFLHLHSICRFTIGYERLSLLAGPLATLFSEVFPGPTLWKLAYSFIQSEHILDQILRRK